MAFALAGVTGLEDDEEVETTTLGYPRCHPLDYEWDCCSIEQPCLADDGDCDSDDECIGDLICGENNCQDDTTLYEDCCTRPCTQEQPCGDGASGCQVDDQCSGSLLCGSYNCDWDITNSTDCCTQCTQDRPCGLGHGDCNLDDDCTGSLVCGEDNCSGDATGARDCCIAAPTYSKQGRSLTTPGPLTADSLTTPGPLTADSQTTPGPSTTPGVQAGPLCSQPAWRCCTQTNPCQHAEGDCNEDDECVAGTECGKDNCMRLNPLTTIQTMDCCETLPGPTTNPGQSVSKNTVKTPLFSVLWWRRLLYCKLHVW